MEFPKIGEWWIHSCEAEPFLVTEVYPEGDWRQVGTIGMRYDYPSEYLSKFDGTPPDTTKWTLDRPEIIGLIPDWILAELRKRTHDGGT